MAKAALKWSGLSVSEKIEKAKSIIISMTGNASFTTPNPTLVTIGAAVTALDSAESDVLSNGGGTKWTSLRNTKEAALDKLMSQLVSYIENIANGNADIIKSAGIAVRKDPSSSKRLEPPQNLIATAASEGSVNLKWKPLEGAVSYKVKVSDDVTPKVWREFSSNITTKSKLRVDALTSGAKLWFTVIGINKEGEGDPSDPAMVRVP